MQEQPWSEASTRMIKPSTQCDFIDSLGTGETAIQRLPQGTLGKQVETRRRCETIEDNSLECYDKACKSPGKYWHNAPAVQAWHSATGTARPNRQKIKFDCNHQTSTRSNWKDKERTCWITGKVPGYQDISGLVGCSYIPFMSIPLHTQTHSPSLTTGSWRRIRNSQHLGNCGCGNDEQVKETK